MKGVRLRKKEAPARWKTLALIVGMLCLLAGLSGCGGAAKDNAASELASSPTSRSDAAGASSAQNADRTFAVQDKTGGEQEAKAGAQGDSGNNDGNQAAVKTDDSVDQGAPGFDGNGAVDGAEGFNRKLIYKANLTMKVENYGETQSQIRDLVQLSGGYILQFSENQSDYEQGGTFTIKVPSGRFASFLDGLDKMKPLKIQRSIQGQDVTEEYTDLESSLKAKQAAESRLLDFMSKAARTEDLLAYSRELANVQGEIEKIKGRMRYLDQNVAFSTVELRVYQEKEGMEAASPAGPGPFLDRVERAMSGSLRVIGVFFQGLLILLAAALPVLLVLAGIGVPVAYYVRRRRKRIKELARSKLLEHNRRQEEARLPEDGEAAEADQK